MDRIPRSGEIYRHFKNKLYQIVTVATHSETKEQLVIYQALYGDFKTYARPLEMFVSEVDHAKYPQVTQKYRFEKVDMSEEKAQECGQQSINSMQQTADDVCAAEKKDSVAKTEFSTAEAEALAATSKSSIAEKKKSLLNQTAEEKLMAFFDTDDFEERYQILVSLQDEITDLMINNIAVVLDVVIPEGDTEYRYEELKRCFRTKQRYENSRLR